ncbi:hypothetical protein HMPREF1624_06461 [Sporothrix schenckii ATCC 58251]|uniref:Zn(2)-C6 fungal-type domain-containing protein n=1 Tax=Sporothrix schenckii (strain ATCC 58251 / de Perez 2211183) TaxID=1391915 RepID=U7PQB4_SPOS1|nr:hypothetical protein HMPREF1624_06461 [Sporothrix schenckii ATCC 58251]
MERQRAARSSKWGEACAPCAAAKTRCIRNRDEPSASCDRCQSLAKDCFGQVQKPRKKRQAKPSRTAQLEERLNSLIQAMSSASSEKSDVVAAAEAALSAETAVSVSATTASSTRGSTLPQASPSSPSSPPVSGEPHVHLDGGVGLPQPPGAPPVSPHCTCRVPVSKADLVPHESDEVLLSIYVNQLSSKFPFVIVPPSTTAQEMAAKRPFLMQVIRMVSSVRHLRSMWGQSRAVIKHIGDAMLMRSERSMDLLQGIIVFLGYYHYFCMSHAHFNNLAHLALSLVGDMGLNAPPQSNGTNADDDGMCQPRIIQRNPSEVVSHTSDDVAVERTNEERRALVGVWYINSNACSVVKQMGSTRYTKYIDQCVKELEKNAEYKSDQLVVELIRIQNLTETISHFHNRDQMLDELPGVPRMSPIVYIEALQAQLDRLRGGLPAHLKMHPLLNCHFHSARLALFAPLLSEEHYLADPSLTPLDLFTRFTDTLKMWFAEWLTIPVCSYFYLPQPACSMVVHTSRHLVLWARLAGPSAVRLSSTSFVSCPLLASTASLSSGSTATTPSGSGSSPASEPYVPRRRFPAFMGIPSCPTLDIPKRPTDLSDTVTVAAQASIDMIRAAVYERQDLRLDVLGIAAAMAARCESAQVEITAAQGGEWKNDTWDAAGDQMRIKRSKIEEWVESATAAGVDEDVPLTFGPMPGELSQDGHNSTNWKWPSDLAYGPTNLDFGTLLDSNNDWNTDWNAQGMVLDN